MDDHVALANYFEARATKLRAESEEHRQMAANLRRDPVGRGKVAFVSPNHCDYYAQKLSKDSQEAARQAEAQRQMASAATGL